MTWHHKAGAKHSIIHARPRKPSAKKPTTGTTHHGAAGMHNRARHVHGSPLTGQSDPWKHKGMKRR